MSYRPTLAMCCSLLAIAVLASFAGADTLELNSGEILEGVYMGGSQNTVRFAVDGAVQTVPVADILALTFSGQQLAELEPEPLPPSVEPAPEPVPVGPRSAILAPAGSSLLVRMIDSIDSRQHRVGHRFTAELEADFTHNGRLLARRGSYVYGTIVDANQAGRLKGKTHLTLELRDIMIDNELYPIVTGEYELAGKKSSGKRTAFTTLGGAALGALIGGKGDRAEGAAIGAGAGLGVSAITKGEQIQIPSGTLLDFRLVAPFTM